jgi:hypothetical protein
MSITMNGLYHADVGRVLGTADRWGGLVTGIDDAVDDLVEGTRDLPVYWSGEGAQAGLERNHTLQVQVGNASHYMNAIRAALITFAGELTECQRLLYDVLANAHARGLDTDFATGRVHVPYHARPARPDDIVLAGPMVDVDGYNLQIEQLVSRANDADRAAADMIDDSHLGDFELPEVDIDEVSQLQLEATLSYDADDRAEWWHSLHQLNRDQLIASHPEIVGAGEGLPTADRDAANRLLLQREKDALLAQRAQVDQQLGHAAGMPGPAVAGAVVDFRLAEIAGTEQQLTEPGARLLGVQPTTVGKADPKWDDYPG